MIKNRETPFSAWTLITDMTPKQVEIISRERWGKSFFGCLGERRGRWILAEELHETKAEAIAYGRKKLEAQRASIQKQLDNIERRTKNLDKAGLAECAE